MLVTLPEPQLGPDRENASAFRRPTLVTDTPPMPTAAVKADVPGLDLAIELAHDVRSPIGAVIALAELLQTGACGPVTAAQKYQLALMQQAARGRAR